MEPALLTVDWGTTSVRLTAVAADGTVLGSTHSHEGILTVGQEPSAYTLTLDRLAGSWAATRPAVIACGMVGSAKGWREAPYLPTPVDLLDGAPLTEVAGPWGPVHLVPGVCTHGGVMRGEETQLLGLVLAGHRDGVVALPGTHTKWALLTDGSLTGFHTAMTGELFALLTTHGTLAQVVGSQAPEAPDWPAFEMGVHHGLAGAGLGAAALAFGVRARALLEQVPPERVREELSGVLIGSEIAGALHWLGDQPETVSVVASAGLTDRYRRALTLAGVRAEPAPEDVTSSALVHLARQAGLIEGAH
ncbi:2-dehydro-3-deoxygalactonokinase [Ruania alkalisoli]|uniref:2-dehydro-3-deoxygalactonokinase n=1 Tax=Ruania alkalisoli TaxID=2779775 RepID=A0A7M1SW45_9MICO|nr:2-dehydro-3-deoxygalactonokinase [Ruania alkalisoli]QOR70972.1 2-dehydro-3-deoxygalactonokinase [Ruania alkalisoli]